ncbi:MAG: hypothetical protein ACI8QI_001486 [Limisphaerales bacterium]|jgi:hypothetical protein
MNLLQHEGLNHHRTITAGVGEQKSRREKLTAWPSGRLQRDRSSLRLGRINGRLA